MEINESIIKLAERQVNAKAVIVEVKTANASGMVIDTLMDTEVLVRVHWTPGHWSRGTGWADRSVWIEQSIRVTIM